MLELILIVIVTLIGYVTLLDLWLKLESYLIERQLANVINKTYK